MLDFWITLFLQKRGFQNKELCFGVTVFLTDPFVAWTITMRLEIGFDQDIAQVFFKSKYSKE